MQNYYELDKYHEALQKSEFPIYRGLRLSYEDRMRHQIIKHFRIYDTLDLENFEKEWGVSFHKEFSKEIAAFDEFVKDGLIKISEAELSMTPLGREFTPRICEVFDKYEKKRIVR